MTSKTSKSKVIDLIDQYIKNTNERNNKPELTSSSWYLPNRAGFVKSIHSIFKDYELKKQDEGDKDLDKAENNKLDLFPHQKFVRDYMQEDAPSRGLLLYHGLGVGKTCASIATAELLATNMKICVMLPASLKSNYINEVLKCGHPSYSLNQNWSFIHHKQVSEINKLGDMLDIIDKKTYDKNGGFWFTTPNKKSNYDKYDEEKQEQINRQLQNIIKKKYNILHYNGLNNKIINTLTEDDTINPFDNSIVIIDEVHNFVSRVINGSKIAEKVYELIYYAKNCKVLCLSGTPLINKPLELAFLVNLIKRPTIEYKLNTNESLDDKKIRKLEDILDDNKFVDNYTYDAIEKRIILKLVPINFAKNKNLKLVKDAENIRDTKTLQGLKELLNKNDFKFNLHKEAIEYQPLPTNENKFNKLFINEEDGKLKNEELLIRRILGSVSYFVYTKSELFPDIRTNEVIEVELSDIQLKKYIDVRQDEIRKEKNFKKQSDANQVYKAFTRMLCNFTFPEEIERPYPSKLKLLLSDMDVVDDYHKNVQDKLVKYEEKKKKEAAAASSSSPSPSKVIPTSSSTSSTDKYLKFYSKSKEGKVLSNFADIEVVVDGKLYITGEHAFHGQKYISASKIYSDEILTRSDDDRRIHLLNYAKKFEGKDTEFKTALDAKRGGGKRGAKLEDNEIKNWNEKDADEVQKQISLYKYENNLEVRTTLNKYKDSILIHQDNRAKSNTPWGARVKQEQGKEDEIIGHNKLGKIWMRLVENKIKKKTSAPTPKESRQAMELIIETDKYSAKNYNEDDYQKKIQEILTELYDNKDQYLMKDKDLKLYSPKFHKILELLGKSEGSALIYSQFRTVEGLGILKLVLKANGYAEFKIKKHKNTFIVDIEREDYNKPKFAEFTGDKEMTSVLLDIFNNELDKVPKEITKELDKMHWKHQEINNGNLRGSLIKAMMITQSGSEGISLKNVRQVHLVEPYWNMIRMDQVVGRAARTGSHSALPKSERNIDVYKYLCTFSKEHLKERKIQKMDRGLTTDQVINNIAERKAAIMNSLLDLLKKSAVDCHLHKKNHPDVECFSYPINIKDDELVIKNDIEKEELDYMKKQREEQVKLDLNTIIIKDIEYMILFDKGEKRTGQLFDKDEYDKFETIKFVGLLLKNDKDQYILRLVKE
tara:strand:- start:8384 stop:11872 length:3489 start_codon:yes stop_codon:yes gene_type:complete